MLISCTEKQVLNCFSFFPPALTEVLANFALLTFNWLIVLDCLKSFFIFASVLLPCFLFRLALTAHSSLVDCVWASSCCIKCSLITYWPLKVNCSYFIKRKNELSTAADSLIAKCLVLAAVWSK